MLWIVIFSIIGFVGLCALIFAIFEDSTNTEGKASAAGLAALCLVVNLAFSGLSMVHIVDARNIGVVRTFGSITGQVGEGFQVTWPWQDVEEWNIRLQVIEPDTFCSNKTEKCMDAGSVDIQDVYIQAALNIEVDVRDVQNLARNVGKNYPDIIVRNRMQQVVKRVTATYRADQILEKREEIRSLVREGMITELAPYSITVTDFLITNIDFTDQFRASIDAKQKATQDALTAENIVRIREAEARQAAAVAFGAAERLRIEAQGQADANRTVAASLTPQLIQFQAVQRLSDKIQIALIPSGQGLIIDPSNIFRPTP